MSTGGFVKAQSDNLPKINVFMVAEYISNCELYNAAETRGVKAQRSQRDNYGDAAVGYVEVKREARICIVRARICPEHKVRNKPYSVELKINEISEKVLEVKCHDCAASAGGCKHAIAFLMWIHRRSEEPEPTATVCYWKKPTLAQVGSNIKFIKTKQLKEPNKKYNFLNTDSFFQNVMQELEKTQCNTQISRHYFSLNSEADYSLHQIIIKFHAGSTESVNDFLSFANSQMSTEGCKKIAELTKSQSDSKLWSELRYCRITASKIYEIAQCKTKNGTLVEQIIGTSKVINTDAMERGKKLEKEVLREVSKQLDLKLDECGLILSPEYPVIGASPDAIGEDFEVEVKCPISSKTESKYITANGQVTKRYAAQIQLQMFMKQVKKGYFCVAKPDFEQSKCVRLLVVDYNEIFIKNLIESSMTFWRDNIFPYLFNSVK